MNDTELRQLAIDVVTRLSRKQNAAVAGLSTPKERYRLSRYMAQAAHAQERLYERWYERTLTEAGRLVANDVRRSYPEMTDEEAIAHVKNTVDPDSVYDDPDGDKADDQLTWAYMTVLGMTEEG